jgi:hypothetical protein
VVFLDSSWNPDADLQAVCRLVAPNTKVCVTHLLLHNSIDEHTLQAAFHRHDLSSTFDDLLQSAPHTFFKYSSWKMAASNWEKEALLARISFLRELKTQGEQLVASSPQDIFVSL